MRQWRSEIQELPRWAILPYLAGRFDGDGSVAADGRQDVRIVYGSREEASTDQRLLQRVRDYSTRIYTYHAARTWVLYISRYHARDFLSDLRLFSSKLNPVETDPFDETMSKGEIAVACDHTPVSARE